MYDVKSFDILAAEKMTTESREWKHLPQKFLCALCTPSPLLPPLNLHATTDLFLILQNSLHLVEFYVNRITVCGHSCLFHSI